MERYYVCPGVLDDASDEEFTREEWLAWYEGEFAGYDPEPVVEDDAGEREEREELAARGWSQEDIDWLCPPAIEVSEWQLAEDRATLAHLGRVWRGAYRFGPDGERVVAGAHPFSTEEGSAEWLGRMRVELRFLYREARTDAERNAIVAREAALRARHNARCWARAFARYHGLDERDTLRMLDGWQKQNPIGWLGLEAAMKSLFESTHDHYFDAHRRWEESAPAHTARWNVALKRYDIRRVTREEQDAWLDREPLRPEYPTQLVTSKKSLRRYAEVALETVPVDLAELQAQPMPVREGHRPQRWLEPGLVKAIAREARRDRHADGWTEFSRSEVEWVRNEVPEDYPVAFLYGDIFELPRTAAAA